MNLTKQLPVISFDDFKAAAISLKGFKSFPKQKKYEVSAIDGDIIHFIRRDADSSKIWSFNLSDVYRAYQELDNFNTLSFKKYVPIRHSPARGLLVDLKLLK